MSKSLEKIKILERESKFFQSCYALKPNDLFIKELNWKYLIRNVYRGENVLILGKTRTAKTTTAIAIAKALNRPYFIFQFGAMQDARSSLIGFVHFSKETGTYLAKSEFVHAIQTENAVIIADEISRSGPDATNIMIGVLDPLTRCINLDEDLSKAVGDRCIKVDPTVSFIATANIGNEYTATRAMDLALTSRFIKAEIDELEYDDEIKLLKLHFPYCNSDTLGYIAELACHTRTMVKQSTSKITHSIPTGTTIQIASLVNDGFTLEEAAAALIYPEYSDEGGVESERTYIKQKVQQYIATPSNPDKLFSLTPAGDPEDDDDDN